MKLFPRIRRSASFVASAKGAWSSTPTLFCRIAMTSSALPCTGIS